jgi:hypothetical protein
MAARKQPWLDSGDDVTIRRAGSADGTALRRLAALAESRPLHGDVLVAEVAGELRAALALDDGRTIADPFRPTLALRELLQLRRAKLVQAAGMTRRLRLARHRLA